MSHTIFLTKLLLNQEKSRGSTGSDMTDVIRNHLSQQQDGGCSPSNYLATKSPSALGPASFSAATAPSEMTGNNAMLLQMLRG